LTVSGHGDTMALTMKSKSLVIGIAGGSGSGKTTLVDMLCSRFSAETVLRISHDVYYHDLSHLPMAERSRTNFDHPDALDTEALIHDLERLRSGEAVMVPEYDYSRHCRVPAIRPSKPAPVILLEGILILTDVRLRSLMDIKVYVDADSDVRLLRRLERDMRERGRTFSSVREQYETTVQPMHREFVTPSRSYADMVVLDSRNPVIVDLLVARIQDHLRDLDAWK